MRDVGDAENGAIVVEGHTDLEKLSDFLGGLREYKRLLETAEGAVPRTIGPLVVTRGSNELEQLVPQIESLRQGLVRQKGWAKRRVLELTGKPPIAVAFGVQFDAWDRALEKSRDAPLKGWALEYVGDAVTEAIGILEAGATLPEPKAPTVPPKAFIAHGGMTRALQRLCEFVRALGVDPIVVELQPSEGRSVNRQVERNVRDSECGIVFATKGGIKDTKSGREHPRLNVIDEFATLRNQFPGKVILLLEKGVELPSNISEFVYERFTRDNLENAFLKVAAELRAFGIIRAEKPSR